MTNYLGGSFGIAIIVLTVIVNLAMLPLTQKQMHASKVMQDLQPKLAELQRKHAKDKQKLAQEQMRMYKESGVSPAGCLLPMLIQMPIWVAVYQSIMLALAVAPEGLLNLSRYLYSWPLVYSLVPLSRSFLGLDLSSPNWILAVLVGGTMWLQQKMSTPVSTDPKQRQQSQMMLWMMPLMFGFLALSFPSGLSLFWATSSIVRIILQYRVTGLSGLVKPATGEGADRDKKYLKLVARGEEESSESVGADIVEKGGERGKGGLGYPAQPSKMRYQPGRDRSRRHKKK